MSRDCNPWLELPERQRQLVSAPGENLPYSKSSSLQVPMSQSCYVSPTLEYPAQAHGPYDQRTRAGNVIAPGAVLRSTGTRAPEPRGHAAALPRISCAYPLRKMLRVP